MGDRRDGAALARLRGRLTRVLDEASEEVAAEARLPTQPASELLLVDRRAWIAGNVRTLRSQFGDTLVTGAETKLVSLEGGAFLGLLARAVLAQYDPYRDLLLVVHPNLRSVAQGDGIRWLMFHEVTHLAQFRHAPWMAEHIVQTGKQALGTENREWLKDAASRLRSQLPDMVRWARDALEGRAEGTPLLDILPPEQKEIVLGLHALVTVLEGHATYVTDRIAQRRIPDYEQLQRRIRAERKRPPLIRLLEAIAGLEMKRQQYVLGRVFCETVWERGGPEALEPAWRGPEGMPSFEEIRAPERWLERVGAAGASGGAA